MPKELERKLRVQARKKGFVGKRADKYVFGALRKTGWTPSSQKKSKKTLRESVLRSRAA